MRRVLIVVAVSILAFGCGRSPDQGTTSAQVNPGKTARVPNDSVRKRAEALVGKEIRFVRIERYVEVGVENRKVNSSISDKRTIERLLAAFRKSSRIKGMIEPEMVAEYGIPVTFYIKGGEDEMFRVADDPDITDQWGPEVEKEIRRILPKLR